MDNFGGPNLDGPGTSIRKKRSQTTRRPRPEPQPFPEWSSLSSTPHSDDVSKVSSDENIDDTSSHGKMCSLHQCISRGYSNVKDSIPEQGSTVAYSNGGFEHHTNQGQKHSGVTGKSLGNEKLKKVKLKVGGVTHTIQTKSTSHGTSSSGTSTKSNKPSDAPRSRNKLNPQGNSEKERSPPIERKSAIRLKDSSSGPIVLGKEEMGKTSTKNAERRGDNSDPIRKSKRIPKKRVLDADFDEDDDDDEIRYLEKLKTSKVVAYSNFEEESSKRQKGLYKVSKGVGLENSDDFEAVKDGKRYRSEKGPDDEDYDGEESLFDDEIEERKNKQKKDPSDSPIEGKREIALTTRQRALLSGKDASSGTQIEFPNGLPPPPPRKQKEKLSEVEQQLKRAEAAERRRMQNEKAARESEAEAIRKILGQDSSRKKREDKIKKRHEELAQEKAARAQMLASNTVRWVMGLNGTIVTFPQEMGLPQIFDPKPSSYPPPREKCAGPSCTNPYKYRDSKSKLPLCSLQCYKAIHEKMQPEAVS